MWRKARRPPVRMAVPTSTSWKMLPCLMAGGCCRFTAQQHFLPFGLARPEEVDGTVDTPHPADPQGDVRLFPAHAGDRERPDQVEEHDRQVCQQAQDRNYHMFD